MDNIWPPLPPHLEVKQSLILDAGMGLFTKRKIKKDKRIVRYRGVYYKRTEASDTVEESHKPYLAHIEGRLLDGYQLNNHGRWANHKAHIDGRHPNDPNEPNALLMLMDDLVVFLVALRDIEAEEEIYIDYGEEFQFPGDPPLCMECGESRICYIAGEPSPLCTACSMFNADLEEATEDHREVAILYIGS
jgi:SET domain-containing protein